MHQYYSTHAMDDRLHRYNISVSSIFPGLLRASDVSQISQANELLRPTISTTPEAPPEELLRVSGE